MELEKSESLSRAREQHENVVMATKKRHEEDLARLKQKLDEVNSSLMWKVTVSDFRTESGHHFQFYPQSFKMKIL